MRSEIYRELRVRKYKRFFYEALDTVLLALMFVGFNVFLVSVAINNL